MIEFIENEHLRVKIKVIGAELCGLYNKHTETEHIWQAQPPWRKYAPWLFPIVGQLKNDLYTYNGDKYKLTRHGFARERLFRLAHIATSEIHFELSDDETTLPHYPFYFNLLIKYQLGNDNTLYTQVEVTNRGDGPMYFSVGGHPAFNVPFIAKTEYSDYCIEWDQGEEMEIYPLVNGLVDAAPIKIDSKYLSTTTNNRIQLQLHKNLFANDALIFKHIRSSQITLKHLQSNRGVKLDTGGAPYFGVWAAPQADFVCLEPWHGIADGIDTNQDITTKEGIIHLAPGQSFKTSMSFQTL